MSHDNIEVDPAVLEHSDKEDYVSCGYDTSTASLTSSIYEYVFENGRRYHAYYGKEKNLMPTDETEQDRLDLHHEIFIRLLNGELYRAPIGDNPQKILDIGTGTGIWAIDVANKHPSAEVIGVDLSPIQPGWVPPNCRFELDDIECQWSYGAETFDFIHARNLTQSIANWPNLMKEVFRATKPGGYVELAEVGCEALCDDGTMKPDNGLLRGGRLLDGAMTKIGRLQPLKENLIALLKDSGFQDIVAFTAKQPFGPWPKDPEIKLTGAMALHMCVTGIEAYSMAAFTRILGMTEAAAKKLCNDTLKDVMNKNVHMYNNFYVVYGRKPE